MRVSVNGPKCVGAGQCVVLASSVFDQDDNGVAFVVGQPTDDVVDDVREAVEACPAMAIDVVED